MLRSTAILRTNKNIRKPEFPLFPHSLWRPNPVFLESSVLPDQAYDPWRRRDDWRYNEFFSARKRLIASFPGLSYGMGALTIYVLFDQYDRTYGEAADEKKKWEEWLEKRNREKGIHSHGHGEAGDSHGADHSKPHH